MDKTHKNFIHGRSYKTLCDNTLSEKAGKCLSIVIKNFFITAPTNAFCELSELEKEKGCAWMGEGMSIKLSRCATLNRFIVECLAAFFII